MTPSQKFLHKIGLKDPEEYRTELKMIQQKKTAVVAF